MDEGAAYLLQVLAANTTSAGANGTAHAGGATAVKKKPKKHYYFMARNSWETIAGVILALAILNLFTRGLAYLRRRRNANKSAADFLSKREGSATSGDVSISNIPYAGRSILQNLGMCTVVPWWLGGATLGEVFWNVGYCGALGVFSFHQSKFRSRFRCSTAGLIETSRFSQSRHSRRMGKSGRTPRLLSNPPHHWIGWQKQRHFM